MNSPVRSVVGLGWMALLLVAATAAAQAPRLRVQGTATQLVVDGRPFLVRGGELGNSAATDTPLAGQMLVRT